MNRNKLIMLILTLLAFCTINAFSTLNSNLFCIRHEKECKNYFDYKIKCEKINHQRCIMTLVVFLKRVDALTNEFIVSLWFVV